MLNILLGMVSPKRRASLESPLTRDRDSDYHHNLLPSAKQFSNVGSSTMSSSRGERINPNVNNKTLAIVVLDLGLSIGLAACATMLANRLLKNLRSDGDEDSQVSGGNIMKRLHSILAKRRDVTKPIPTLTHRELQMADEIVHPDDIDASFAQIGGLDHIKQEIYELAVLPLVNPSLFTNSKLRQPAKGILLYGKPGTGKTMLAKALAKEAEAIFLPLQLSKILNKYWGESNKLIAATFSLANKVQPAVIFIDELDTFLKNSNSETAYMDSIKAEFLTLWDGVSTSYHSRVLVLGATNKPHHIDPAILRRMPRTFEVPLPDATGRLSILELTFREEVMEDSARQYLKELALSTEGYSGSDLKELCKAAAMVPVQERTAEFSRRRVMGEAPNQVQDDEPIRPISLRDLQIGKAKVQKSGEAARQYGSKEQQRTSSPISMDDLTMRQLASLLQAFTKPGRPNQDDIPNV